MIKDITGQKFGNLTAIEIVGKYNKASVWLCRCSCGKETRVVLGNLMGGNTKSCGCGRGKRRMASSGESAASYD